MRNAKRLTPLQERRSEGRRKLVSFRWQSDPFDAVSPILLTHFGQTRQETSSINK